jgi:polyphosphate kinase
MTHAKSIVIRNIEIDTEKLKLSMKKRKEGIDRYLHHLVIFFITKSSLPKLILKNVDQMSKSIKKRIKILVKFFNYIEECISLSRLSFNFFY